MNFEGHPAAVELLADIKESIGTTTTTVNDVLSYEKIHSNLMKLEFTLQSPVELVVTAFQMFKLQAQAAGISLIFPINYTLGNSFVEKVVAVDVFKLNQVLRNLGSNALKFTRHGGEIKVDVKEVDYTLVKPSPTAKKALSALPKPVGWIHVTVQDSGVGIDPVNLPRLFHEVIQFDANINQGGNGSGLGLFIAKGIVELHGGGMSVHSEGLGHGSIFGVYLPIFSKTVDISVLSTVGNKKFQTPFRLLGRSVSVLPLSVELIGQSSMVPSPSLPKDFGSSSLDRFGNGNVNSNIVNNSNTHINNNINNDESHDNENTNHNINSKYVLNQDSTISTSTLLLTGFSNSSSAPITPQSIPYEPIFTLLGTKILVVDDSLASLKMMTMLFHKLGADCVQAVDGLQALHVVQSNLNKADNKLDSVFDMIVMDNMMPNMSGQDACRKMREIGFVNPIYGLTGHSLPQDIEDYLAAGANYIFTKPLDRNDLKQVITKHLNNLHRHQPHPSQSHSTTVEN